MATEILDPLVKWIKNKENYKIGNKSSVINLLKLYGCQKLIWLNIAKEHISIEAFSDDLLESSINRIIKKHDDAIIKWIKSGSIAEKVNFGNLHLSCLLLEDKNFNNYWLVLGDIDPSSLTMLDIRKITMIGLDALRQASRILILENSLKIAHSDLQRQSSEPAIEFISPEDLPQKFINGVVPAIWYSVAHEAIGPTFIEADPSEVDSPYNLGKVVNIFSTLDSNMIGTLGHVFSITPMNEPYLGEATNVIFSILNNDARGGIELHSLTIVIGQEFVNLSKALYLDIKSALFTGVEAIRQKDGSDQWKLVLTNLNDSLNEVKAFVKPILKTIRGNIASIIASLISKDDVENW